MFGLIPEPACGPDEILQSSTEIVTLCEVTFTSLLSLIAELFKLDYVLGPKFHKNFGPNSTQQCGAIDFANATRVA